MNDSMWFAAGAVTCAVLVKAAEWARRHWRLNDDHRLLPRHECEPPAPTGVGALWRCECGRYWSSRYWPNGNEHGWRLVPAWWARAKTLLLKSRRIDDEGFPVSAGEPKEDA